MDRTMFLTYCSRLVSDLLQVLIGRQMIQSRFGNSSLLFDLATRKQDWNRMCREVCGPRDYLEEHKKKKLKKQKEMEVKYQGEGGEIHGSGHGGSVKDGQFMG